MNYSALYAFYFVVGLIVNIGIVHKDPPYIYENDTNMTVASDLSRGKQFNELIYCVDNSECNYPKGKCVEYTTDLSICNCKDGYLHKSYDEPCTYHQKDKVASFLFSLFLGEFGADYFYLHRGNGGYIAAGIFKLVTIGGLGVWWLVDWIRILADTFNDGNGLPLSPW